MNSYFAAVVLALAIAGLVIGTSIMVTAEDPVPEIVEEIVTVVLPDAEPQAVGCNLPIFYSDTKVI